MNRQWKKNQHIVLRENELDFREDFFTEKSEYIIFYPNAVNPPVLTHRTGVISISTVTYNASFFARILPIRLSSQELRSRAVEAIVGDWSCDIIGVYGNDSATSRIRECGKCLH